MTGRKPKSAWPRAVSRAHATQPSTGRSTAPQIAIGIGAPSAPYDRFITDPFSGVRQLY